MTKEKMATMGASLGAGLLFATAAFHFSAYGTVTASASEELRPVVAACWVAVGIALMIAALLAVAATPGFVVRRRSLLMIAALTPLSIAILQIVYLGFIPPTFLLLFDAAVLIAAGELGRIGQPRPVVQ